MRKNTRRERKKRKREEKERNCKNKEQQTLLYDSSYLTIVVTNKDRFVAS